MTNEFKQVDTTVGNDRTIYGKFSLGAGAILKQGDGDSIWNEFEDENVIGQYVASVKKDLERSGIDIADLANWTVMDVGTGRQAIALHLLGAKRVEHFDISPEAVASVNNYAAKRGLSDRIVSVQGDLSIYPLGKDKYDFVYLNGIAQHLPHVGNGLANCIAAMKEGGHFWLYFYRSGTFLNFMITMIRDLIKGHQSAEDCFINSTIIYTDEAKPSLHVSNIMDDFYVKFIHLYSASTYLDFLDKAGMKVVADSKLAPADCDFDHRALHDTVLLTVQKVRNLEITEDVKNILSPATQINQLEPSVYQGNEEILLALSLYQDLKKALAKRSSQLTMSTALRLYDFLHRENDLGLNSTNRGNHKKLQTLLRNITDLLK